MRIISSQRRRSVNVLTRATRPAMVETLEMRWLLNAAIVVDTTSVAVASDGVTSLPEALTLAENTAGDDTITFDPTVFTSGTLHTITPGAEPFQIPTTGGKVTIQGPGADVLEIDATTSGRSFDVPAAANAEIDGMEMTNGSAQGGGVSNLGMLSMSNVLITGNSFTSTAGPTDGSGTSGDDAQGGGIYNSGTLSLTSCTISNNSVTGGAGGTGLAAGGEGGDGQGGGLYSTGGVTIQSCTFSGNIATGGVGGGGLGAGGNGGNVEGGAIYMSGGHLLDIENSMFTGNAGYGGAGLGGNFLGGGIAGGVIGGQIYSDSTVTLNASTITEGIAMGGAGGAAGLSGSGGSGGSIDGGGIFASASIGGSSDFITKNTATGGAAGSTSGVDSSATGGMVQGGGMYLASSVTGSLTEATISNNQAVGSAGGDTDLLHGGADGGSAAGGGVFSNSGDFTFTDAVFDSNQASGGHGGVGLTSGNGGEADGGAIYYDGGGILFISGDFITNNTAAGGNDGAAANGGVAGTAKGGGIAADGHMELYAITFDSNSATGGNGLSDDTSEGGAGRGGALETSADLSVIKCVFTNNTAAGGFSTGKDGAGGGGGGMAVIGGTFSMERTTLSNNSADGGKAFGATALTGGSAVGGGLLTVATSAAITSSTFDHNTAQSGQGSDTTSGPGGDGGSSSGGGLFASATTTIANSTIYANETIAGKGGNTSDNAAGGDSGGSSGGGVTGTNVLVMLNDTITANTAQTAAAGTSTGGGASGTSIVSIGGGIYPNSSTTVTNTIVANNTASLGSDIHGTIDASHDLIKDVSDVTFNTDVSDLKGIDPQLGALAGNGGPTKTLLPAPGSPVHDKGDTSAAIAEFGAGGFDQRDVGFTRYLGAVDIGSVESGTPTISVSGNGNAIADNDTTPSASDFTDFGTQVLNGAAVQRTFVVTNTGTADLTLNAPTLPAGYSLVEPLDGTLAAGTSDSFTVQLSTGTIGIFSGNISIASNDLNTPTFNFAVTGTIVGVPAIAVSGNGNAIPNNESSPSSTNFTDFGTQDRYAQPIQETFVVKNNGSATLTLSTPVLPSGYTVTEPLSGTLAPGASDSFAVQLNTASPGIFAGNISIASNDPNTPTFNFKVTGSISTTFKINFEPTASPVPDGYVADTGLIFGNRGNGLSYGWNQSAVTFSRDRNVLIDQAKDTFIHTELYGNRTWEVSVPNGAYIVDMVAGDPSYFDSTYKINAENTLLVNGKPTTGSRFVEGTATVIVTDGRLTLSNAAGSVNNKFDYVVITPTSPPPPPPPPPPSTIKINFETSSSSTPAGYLADTGAIFANRGNGYSYGWNLGATTDARDRNAGNSPDQEHDTFIHTELYGTRTWEIALPNGSYHVHLVSGDPSFTDSVYKYNLEGTLALSGTPTAGSHWIDGMVTISVSDGRLTLTNAAGSVNNKIDFIEITPV